MCTRLGICIIAASFLLGGCAASIHPVAPEEGRAFDASLLGKWKLSDEDGSEDIYTVEEDKPDGYVISFLPHHKALTLTCSAHVFRLGDAMFYDATFTSVSLKDEKLDPGELGVYATHAFGRVWIQRDEIRLRPLNEDWLEKALNEKKVTLNYEPGAFRSGVDILLSGPGEEIRAFARKYADDKEVFSEESVFKRQK
jgi:hypothetical protein